MIYKLYLIEIIGSFPILFGLFSVLVIVLSICLLSKYDSDIMGVYDHVGKAEVKKKFKKRIITLLSCLIICLSVTVLIPSKVFMYSVTGVSETIKFLQGNDEVKKISEKTIRIINNKLDTLIDDESIKEDAEN